MLFASALVFKPLYGLLSDFVPFFGTRRRSYLLLTTAITSLGLGYLYFSELHRGNTGILLAFLLLPTFAVAFSDVVIDALMVEKGQPFGLTGLLQSAQWTAMYAGMILAGQLGGYLSQSTDSGACVPDLRRRNARDASSSPGSSCRSGHDRRQQSGLAEAIRANSGRPSRHRRYCLPHCS